MGFNQFLQEVGSELQEILWKDVSRGPLGGKFYRLEQELHRASVALSQLRTSVDQLRSGLAEKERRAHWLEAQVKLYLHIADQANAWRYALELDGLRPRLNQERARLQRRRQAYHEQLARIRDLQQQLDDFQFEL